MKAKKKRWIFNGIKRFCPNLTFEDWLKICKRGQHLCYHASEVLEGFIKANNPE